MSQASLLVALLLTGETKSRFEIQQLGVEGTVKEVVATDKLYEEDSGHHVYAMLFTVTLGWMNNMPVVTHIHGTPTYEADAEYLGTDATVDYDFTNITFPQSLPDWYFDPRSYAENAANAPL